jgi:hypothetical protein
VKNNRGCELDPAFRGAVRSASNLSPPSPDDPFFSDSLPRSRDSAGKTALIYYKEAYS